MVKLRSELDRLQREGRAASGPWLLLLEGFLLLQDAPIMAAVDGLVFLDASKEASLARRLGRSQRTAHEDEGCRVYYRDVVWPGYHKYTLAALRELRAAAAPHPTYRFLGGDGSAEEARLGALGALATLVPSLAPACTAAAGGGQRVEAGDGVPGYAEAFTAPGASQSTVSG